MCHSFRCTKGQGLLPAQLAKRPSCRDYRCGVCVISLPLGVGKGRSYFGVVLVPVRAAFQTWWNGSCFGRMPEEAGGLAPQGNVGAEHMMRAR